MPRLAGRAMAGTRRDAIEGDRYSPAVRTGGASGVWAVVMMNALGVKAFGFQANDARPRGWGSPVEYDEFTGPPRRNS